MKRVIPLLLFILLQLNLYSIVKAQATKNKTVSPEKLNLSGTWAYRLDSLDVGIAQHW